MAKYFNEVDTTVLLETEKDLTKYFDFAKTNTYVSSYCKETTIVGIGNEPLLHINGAGEFIPDDRCPDISKEDFETAVVDRGLFVMTPVDGEMKCYPSIYTSFNGLCARAGIRGTLISNTDESRNFNPMDAETRGNWLTYGFHHNKGGVKFRICDGFVDACNSDSYIWLSEKEGYKAVVKALKKEHPETAFRSGMVSHEYLYVELDIKDDIATDGFSQLLQNYGVDVSTLVCGAYYCTSDVGNACMSVFPFYDLNGVRFRLGKGISLRHEGEASIKKFSAALKDLGMLFKEAEDTVEKLGNTTIKYPAGCLQQIVENNSWLPTKAAKMELEDALALYGNGTKSATAFDVYLMVAHIIETYASLTKQMTPTQRVNYSEEVAKLLNLDYSKMDVPYDEA